MDESQGKFRGSSTDCVEALPFLLDTLIDFAIIRMDPRGLVCGWNAGAVQVFGYAPEEILGRDCGLLFTPEDLKKGVLGNELRSAETMGRATDERWHVRKDGRRFWASGILYQMSIAGKALGFVKVVRDITDKRQAADNLVESERKLEFFLEQMKDHALFMIDTDARIASWNKGAERLLGFKEEEILRQPFALLFTPEDVQAGTPHRELQIAEAKGKAEDERWHRKKDDGIFWASGAVMPMTDSSGRTRAFIKILRDATERKRAEDAQKMESIGRLAGGIAHDFNNMLTAINGYCELMKTNLVLEGLAREWIEEIHRAGNRAASLTRQLLAFSRRQVMTPSVVRFYDIIQNMESLLQTTLGESIRLHVLQDAESEEVLVDPAQIEQAILNLALNSRDAMPEGGEVTLRTVPTKLEKPLVTEQFSLDPGPYLLLTFGDTGRGMDAETRARIFEPFFSTKKRGTGSTGLGLSTVYGIIRQSGGGITVSSEPGRGTEFAIYLPIVRKEHALKAALPAPEEPGEHRWILLVEDESTVRTLAARALTKAGYKILEAKDGEEALVRFQEHPGTIGLVLTDVVMPNMGGIELARRIHSIYPETRIAFMSGYPEQAFNQGISEGMIFIQKPFTITNLVDKVKEAFTTGGPVNRN